MSDEWELGVPKEDPEARKASLVRDGNGCPRLVPDGNFVEGDMSDEGMAPERPDVSGPDAETSPA